MAHWMNLGQQYKMNARKYADTVALKDRHRAFSYRESNARVNQLVQALLAQGLRKGDAFAVLLENCVEIVELYLAAAKTGLVIVPINFRLVGSEVEYIVNNSDAKAIFVQDEFVPVVAAIQGRLPAITAERYIVVGAAAEGFTRYADLLQGAPVTEPDVQVRPEDPWILIYTSGTTGKPKGVIRSHASHIAFYLINAVDYGFGRQDVCMNVMPLCHINSTFFTFLFLYLGASVYLHPARSFQAEEILELIAREKITFISLIPTHYNLILNVPTAARRHDVSSIRKLLCSSAPVRRQVKLQIMEFFKGVELYEAYGSTEAGGVTILKPEDQLRKLGSIGTEALGTDRVKLLDDQGREVPDGEVGELFSRGPMLFDHYYKLPDKTKASFRGEWFSAGDLARRDTDGFLEIVDRKDNMIITGGEHVYPSEVEEVIGNHPAVFDVAVISRPDDKWGEAVVAVVIPNAPVEVQTLLDWCRDKMAGYKRPKEIIFIQPEEMPRTATGKILHRILRETFCG